MANIDNTPHIIRETNAGYDILDIRDEMLRNREVECVGVIDAQMLNSIARQLRFLARESATEPITLFVNSDGGEVNSGLAIYDVMKAIPCPIRTVCVGRAASMGAVLFASGDQRDILPHGSVLIHDPLIPGGIGGSALQIQEISEDLLRVRHMLAEILARQTGRSLEEIFAKTARDTIFTADEAVEFGLADRVIDTL